MKKTLIWNNITNEEMKLKIVSLPPIKLTQPVVNEIDLEDRDGTLTEIKKYGAETKEAVADYRGDNPLRIAQWLRGEGKVVFGNLEDRYYKARINNMIPIEQILEKQYYTFPIEFRCQPFAYFPEGDEASIIKNGATLIHNKATHISLPHITIYGSGACTFAINGRSFNIKEVGGSITLYSDIEEVANGKGNQMIGLFPYLDTGKNVITWTGAGVTKVKIVPHWRAL